MSCYTDFFLLKSACGTNTSKSGMYLEDIPGVDVQFLASIIQAGHESTGSFIDDLNRIIVQRFSADLQSRLLTAWGVKAIDAIAGLPYTTTAEDAEAGTIGMKIKWKRSAFSRLRISALRFKSVTSITNLELTITDGAQTTTKQISAAADEEVVVDFEFTSNAGSITILYDGLEATPYRSNLTGHSNLACSSCTNGSKRLAFYGMKDGKEMSWTPGILADVTLECDFERATCLALHPSRMELLNLAGHTIMEFALASRRLNWPATSSKEWAKEKSVEFENKYAYHMQQNSKTIADYLQRLDPGCLICKTITHAYQAG